MTTNTPVIAVLGNGRAVFGRFINQMANGKIEVIWEDYRDETHRYSFTPDNIFPITHEGLNLAFERSAHLQLQEAIENNENYILPTEVAYIAQAVQSKAK